MVRYQKFAENVQQLFGDCQKWFEIVDNDQVDGLCNATKRLLYSFQKCEQLAQRLRHVGFEYPDECPEYSVTFQCSRIWNELERSFPTQLTTSLESSLRLTMRSLLLFNLPEFLMHETISHSINSLAASIVLEIEQI